MNGLYKKQTFDNGLVLITEQLSYLRSAAVGFWVKVGSRHETPEINGLSHFLEHMVFKGTQERTAQDIAHQIDTLGGHLDAFTTREHTCFYVKVLDKHIFQALDLLTDMLFCPKLSQKDMDIERQIILEEIHTVEDTPEENIHDLSSGLYWANHPLGQPILGTAESLTAMAQPQLGDFWSEYYRPGQIMVSVVSNIEHEVIAGWLGEYFDKRSLSAAAEGQAGEYAPAGPETVFKSGPQSLVVSKDLEQVHLCVGTKGLPQNHPQRYAEYILNVILGTGTSSRLFQEVREKRGLAYNIYSGFNSYSDTGMGEVYAAVSPQSYPETLEIIGREFAKFKAAGITAEELQRGKDQLTSSLILSLESPTNRMMAQAKFEQCFGRNLSLDEMLADVERVSREAILALARTIFDRSHLSLVTLGPLEPEQVDPAPLAG